MYNLLKKRWIIGLILVVMLAGITGCSGKEKTQNASIEEVEEENKNSSEEKENKEKQKEDKKEADKKDTKESKELITYEDVINHEVTPADQFTYFGDETSGLEIMSYTGTDEIVVIPTEINGAKVVELHKMTFANDMKIKGIKLPETTFTLGEQAFALNNNIQIVVAENTDLTILKAAFLYCSNLREVYFGDKITFLDEFSFSGCGSIRSLEIPADTTEINYKAFSNMNDVIIKGKKGSYLETFYDEFLAFNEENQLTEFYEKLNVSFEFVD